MKWLKVLFACALFAQFGLAVAGGHHRNAFVTYANNSGGSEPIYSGNVEPHGVYVPSTNTTWLAWESYNGSNRIEQVEYYNHTTRKWSAVYNALYGGAVANDHTNPSICRDNDGYWHLFSSHHPFALAHASTINPDDPSSWTIQTPVTEGLINSGAVGPGSGYPHCYNVNGTLYLFIQGPNWSQILLYTSASITNGIVTWNSPITLLDYNGGTGVNGNRAYQGNCVPVGTQINCGITYSNPDDTFRRGLYFFDYDTTTGNMINLQGTTTTTPASFPIQKTTLDADYLVADNPNGSNTQENGATIGVDTNGNWILTQLDSPTPTGTVSYLAYRYSGGVLTGPTTIDTTSSCCDAIAVVPQANGATIIYYSKQNSLGLIEGAIWSVTVSASGVYGSPVLVQQSGNQWPLGEPDAINNPHPDARVYWNEENEMPANPAGFMKGYLYGDSGYVLRQTATLPQPQPIITSPPPNSWNPAQMSGVMGLYGNNTIANPGPNSINYPSPNVPSTTQVNSTIGYSTGKHYTEFIVQQHQQVSGNTIIFGVCSASHSQPTDFIGQDFTSTGLQATGEIDINSTALTTLTGDLINWPQAYTYAMALDLTTSPPELYYRNVTLNGNWNENAAANPATGVGGISLTGLTGAPFYLCTQFVQEQDGIALVGAPLSFAGAVPSGFTAWGN